MTLSAVSNKTWLNVEVTLNSWNRVECSIANAGTAVHGSIQLNENSIGIRKRLACTRVLYVNFARSTEGKTYRDRAPAIRLRRSCRAVHGKAQGRPTTAALSPLCDPAEAIRFAVSHCNGVRRSDCERAVGPQGAKSSKIQVITV